MSPGVRSLATRTRGSTQVPASDSAAKGLSSAKVFRVRAMGGGGGSAGHAARSTRAAASSAS